MAAAITNFPEHLIRDIFNAIPDREKNEILAGFSLEYKRRILDFLNGLSGTHKLGFRLKDFSVDPNLTITAQVGEIDYALF